MKQVLSALLIAYTAVLFSGCNTIEGVGKDVSAVGGATSDAASDTKKKM